MLCSKQRAKYFLSFDKMKASKDMYVFNAQPALYSFLASSAVLLKIVRHLHLHRVCSCVQGPRVSGKKVRPV